MSEADVIDICRNALITMALLSAPIMLAMMILGTVISLFQAVTQINEQTLALVPKILLVFGLLVLLAPFMLGELTSFFQAEVVDRIVAMGSVEATPGP